MKTNSISFRERLYSHFFIRNLMTDLFTRKVGKPVLNNPAPFAYQIGPYRDDYFLYFRSTPSSVRYKNEIFNKMSGYTGYDLLQYLEFHLQRTSSKPNFLKFLAIEIPARIQRFSRKAARQNLTLSLEWTRERQVELSNIPNAENAEIPLLEIVKPDEANSSTGHFSLKPELLSDWSARLSEQTERWIDDTESRFRQLTASYNTGSIVLNNRNHEDKLIQAFILLQQVQAPVQVAKGEQLFNRFTASDIASILQFHFDSFRENKINTLQRKVGDQMERLRPNHPKVKKLADALQEFFYS